MRGLISLISNNKIWLIVILLYITYSPSFGESVQHTPGSLVGFVEMPQAPNGEWLLKSPYGSGKAWGRNETIRHLWLVCREWYRRYPDRPRVRIGDISKPNGGQFPPHNTHAVGLAVDIKTKPNNIVDISLPQQQAFELAELFYTFGASLIFYGQANNFDGLPIVMPLQGHDTHFHVVVNPATVPSPGDWVFMPKATTANLETSPAAEGTVGIVLSCELIGVAAEKDNEWKTVPPSVLSHIEFQLEDTEEPNGTILIPSHLTPESTTVKKQLALPTSRKYRWRILIITSSGQKKQSKWYLLETPQNAISEPKLTLLGENEKVNLPIHFTVLTRNPEASKRITESHLIKEVEKLNDEYSRQNPQSQIIFSFKSVCKVDTVKRSRCSIKRLIDTKRQYNAESWRKLVNSCHDHNVLDPSAINIFLYDAYSKNHGFSSRSTWLQHNSNRPYIFLDWQRTLNLDLVLSIVKEPQIITRYLGENPRLLKNI